VIVLAKLLPGRMKAATHQDALAGSAKEADLCDSAAVPKA
jgi:hypothetical protein